jgi:hypothetical protein
MPSIRMANPNMTLTSRPAPATNSAEFLRLMNAGSVRTDRHIRADAAQHQRKHGHYVQREAETRLAREFHERVRRQFVHRPRRRSS